MQFIEIATLQQDRMRQFAKAAVDKAQATYDAANQMGHIWQLRLGARDARQAIAHKRAGRGKSADGRKEGRPSSRGPAPARRG